VPSAARTVLFVALLIVTFAFTQAPAYATPSYSFTTIDAPGAVYGTTLTGINASGQIVGTYQDAFLASHSFLRDDAGGFTTIDPPDQVYGSFAQGINDAGEIVGYYKDAAGDTHGFLRPDARTGYIPIDDPKATVGTIASGVNTSGQIVGTYLDDSGVYGFLRDVMGDFVTIDDPSATRGTLVQAINDAGQIVGSYMDDSGLHGFLATPIAAVPEPASLLVFGAGLLGLLVCRGKRVPASGMARVGTRGAVRKARAQWLHLQSCEDV
jgi:probable HAF family extracellular repeat protein